MNAKILLLALLVTAPGLRAQTTNANALSHEEVLRRAGGKPTAAATGTATAAPGPDWAATNVSQPANASAPAAPVNPGNDAVRTQAMEARIAQLRAAAATNAVRMPTTRAPRSTPAALPAIPAAATPTPAPAAAPAAANVPPGLGEMTLRPPSSANTIPDPDRLMEAGSINWTAATLEQVLEIYSEFVGRNLLRPAALPKAEIVLKQTTPLTKLEVVRMIEAALYLNQVSVVNVGEKFVTVIPTAEAFKIPGIINTNSLSSLPDLGTIVTRIVQLKYTKPSEMVQILTPFASGTAANPIMPVDSSGMLVLRDNVANVKRMLEMVEKVDQVAQSEIISEVIPIKYAKAEEIAAALSSVGGGSGGTVGTRSTATTPSSGFGNRMGGAGGMGQTGAYGQPGSMPGAASTTPTPSSSASFGDRVRNLITKASQSGDLTILGTTKIIADIRSNSLLVFASRQDMEMIKDIIGKLDVVLSQVLIETIIMDVSLGNEFSLGVTAGQAPRTKDDIRSGGFYNNSGQLSTLNSFLNSSVTNGVFPTGSGLNYFGRFGGDLDVAVNALASDSRVNVIQKPRIQTSHATPASIFVGSTVPYISGTYYGGTYGNSSSYQQLRVGIGLTVTPFINQDGLVVMKIEETIDERGKDVIIDDNPIPETTSRTLSAEIAVRDRETIMLGGFIRNADSRSKSGVPLLKDIPLLGALFSSRENSKARQELIVLMRPTVLRTPELAAMHVDVEKERLPGIRQAEKDLDKVELNKANLEKEKQRREAKPTPQSRTHATETSDFSKSAPFTPEEEKLLYESPATPAP
jgi:type II secretory pathway component GspD/PulD (secretin)